ncbi:MAG: Flagellum site-determining protein YlxH [Syntrophus sp. SKADARSKE-3]|nr:Flagellum site-determining protein YlxH [Syntrophus sp. SKADARSKE-3]
MDQAAGLRDLKKNEQERTDKADAAGRAVRATPLRDHRIRVISITSGKGGVGKTNISANLAYALAKRGKKVLILDADMGLANIDVILGLTPKFNLSHVLAGERTISETIMTGPGGIRILPSASGVQEMADLTKEQKLTLLDELNSLNEDIDYLLIDTAAGIAGNVMYFNMAAEEIIVIATREPTSLTDAYALIKVLYQRHNKKRFKLLVNMVKNQTEAKEVYFRLSQATDHFLGLAIEYLGFILHDEKMQEAVRKQRVLSELHPTSQANKCIVTVAEKLCREQPILDGSGHLKFFWEQIIDRDRG